MLKHKIHINKKTYLLAFIGLVIIVAGLTTSVLKALNTWWATHELVFNKVVNLELKRPIEIKDRQIETQEIIKIIETIPAPEDLETDIEKYVYEVFGIENYRLALAIFKSESGLREDALNTYNENRTVDYGVAQINSTHWDKIEGCSLKEIVEYKGNIDCAYILWDRANGTAGDKKGSFSPWSAFKSGAFIDKLE